MSVCVCVNPELVRPITHQPFKLGLPNLRDRCTKTGLRSLLFWGQFTLISKVSFNLKYKFIPFWASPDDNASPIEGRISKFRPDVQNTFVSRSLLFGGLIISSAWNYADVQWHGEPEVVFTSVLSTTKTLQWHRNDHDSVGRTSKKTSKLRVIGFVRGLHRDRWIPRTNSQ